MAPAAAWASMIEFRSVSKHYRGATRPAVDQLSFEVPGGEICVFVGPSGCGKTTTMRMVNRLIEPTSGEIRIDGRPNTAIDPVELRRGIGYVIQQVGLFPHRTVADNIATVPGLLAWDRRRITQRVDELLALVGLEPELYRERYPAELSGGQQQRVGVARAMAADPPVMLMDEPFGAVDPIARDRLQNEFLQIQARVRKTIIFVTHDVDEAIKMGDRIAILDQGGRLAQFDTPERLLTAPASPFVASFVGADRAIKRLSLSQVRDLPLEAPDGTRSPEIQADLSVRDALSLLLGSGSDRGVVVSPHDRQPLGTLRLEHIRGLFRQPAAEVEAAHG